MMNNSDAFTNKQQRTCAQTTLSLPRLLQLHSQGLYSSARFQQELMALHCFRRTLQNRPKLVCSSSSSFSGSAGAASTAAAAGIATSLDISHDNGGRFLLAGQKRGSIVLFDLSYWGSQEDVRYPQQQQHQQQLSKRQSTNDPKFQYQAEEDGTGASRSRYLRVHAPIAVVPPAPAALSSISNLYFGAGYEDENDRAAAAALEIPVGHHKTVVSARWYPVDSGAFLTASHDGHVLVWDTNAMTTVSSSVPFRSLSQQQQARRRQPSATVNAPLPIHCMEVSVLQPDLVALSSLHVSSVQLMDIRSGATSHSLQARESVGGVASLAWSPASAFVIATGNHQDRTVRLFDIRKTGLRAELCCLDQDALPNAKRVSRAVDVPHLSHLRQQQRSAAATKSNSLTTSSPIVAATTVMDDRGKQGAKNSGNSGSRSNQILLQQQEVRNKLVLLQQQQLQQQQAMTGHVPMARFAHTSQVDRLAWSSCGHYLVSCDEQSVVITWDLLHKGGAIPLCERRDLNCGGATTAAAGGSGGVGKSVLLITDDGTQDTIWYAKNNSILTGVPLIERDNYHQISTTTTNINYKQKLEGHLSSIAAAVAIPNSSQIITSSQDGMLLVWGSSGGCVSSKNNKRRHKINAAQQKRKRLNGW